LAVLAHDAEDVGVLELLRKTCGLFGKRNDPLLLSSPGCKKIILFALGLLFDRRRSLLNLGLFFLARFSRGGAERTTRTRASAEARTFLLLLLLLVLGGFVWIVLRRLARSGDRARRRRARRSPGIRRRRARIRRSAGVHP